MVRIFRLILLICGVFLFSQSATIHHTDPWAAIIGALCLGVYCALEEGVRA